MKLKALRGSLTQSKVKNGRRFAEPCSCTMESQCEHADNTRDYVCIHYWAKHGDVHEGYGKNEICGKCGSYTWYFKGKCMKCEPLFVCMFHE